MTNVSITKINQEGHNNPPPTHKCGIRKTKQINGHSWPVNRRAKMKGWARHTCWPKQQVWGREKSNSAKTCKDRLFSMVPTASSTCTVTHYFPCKNKWQTWKRGKSEREPQGHTQKKSSPLLLRFTNSSATPRQSCHGINLKGGSFRIKDAMVTLHIMHHL